MIRPTRAPILRQTPPGPPVNPAERLKATIGRIMAAEAADGPWAAEGICLDLAGKWAERLRREGIPARLATVDPDQFGGSVLVDGKATRAGKFHAFVIVRPKGGPEIILDASVRQFFAGSASRRGVPEVFVGTAGEAAALFRRFRHALRLEVDGDARAGRYEPTSFADLVYGAGSQARARQVY
ncbi:MAG: hypothetical protein FJZ00_02070 [Candidatus Sericytochromatia bacterium]|uniref:Uncharacterized protein n=1 Tax=Candidatus Tanganyikabacteria bacterium TaxID=2961651 RepID=A0A937X0T8_9BACT|nr:hypothetical protein [Candidatus Tanganyikabacteria bacterium]